MTAKPSTPPKTPGTPQPCKHEKVQVVSRDEDAEFVECLACREIFESGEFKDMSIEEKVLSEEENEDA